MYVNKVLGILTDKMPDNCYECVCAEQQCRLPFTKNYDRMSTKFKTTRHKDCPLVLDNSKN